MLVKLFNECLPDACDILVQRIAQRIDHLGNGEVEPGLIGIRAKLPVDVQGKKHKLEIMALFEEKE